MADSPACKIHQHVLRCSVGVVLSHYITCTLNGEKSQAFWQTHILGTRELKYWPTNLLCTTSGFNRFATPSSWLILSPSLRPKCWLQVSVRISVRCLDIRYYQSSIGFVSDQVEIPGRDTESTSAPLLTRPLLWSSSTSVVAVVLLMTNRQHRARLHVLDNIKSRLTGTDAPAGSL